MLSVADEKVLLCQCRLYAHIMKWLPQWREFVPQWQHTVTNACTVKHSSLFSGILWTEYGTIADTNKTVISSPELTFSKLQKLCGFVQLPPPVFQRLNCINSLYICGYSPLARFIVWKCFLPIWKLSSFSLDCFRFLCRCFWFDIIPFIYLCFCFLYFWDQIQAPHAGSIVWELSSFAFFIEFHFMSYS